MASVETISASGEISPRFEKLLRGVSDELSPEELRHAVSSIKTNFSGKFEDQGEQDLYSCLQLLAKHGLVSEDNLTLLEGFLSPKASKKKSLKEKIQQFKESRQLEVSPGKEESGLTGRERDLEKVMSMLITGSSRVVNLHGISGVGKTKLAMEIVSKWPGRKFKADFREITEMKDVHFHVLNALAPDKTIISFEANPVVELMRQLRQAEQHSDILLLLDNVDKFAGGDDEASTSLNANFVMFLQGLLGPKDYPGKSKLKILLTSRSTLRHAKLTNVDNYEVMALEKASSSALFQNQRIGSVQEGQMEKLLEMCQGNPLIIKVMAAILRQQIADDTTILETIEQPPAAEPPESGIPAAEESRERDVFDSEKEGIDKEQESCLRKMFFFLPSKQLKDSAISMSLFCRSFSVEAAAEVLEVDSSEAVIQLEGLRNSEVLTVDPDVKELTYDIHPLVRTFLRSIGSNQKMFVKVYEKAKGRFHTYFMSKMVHISRLLDKDYMNAFDNFDLDKPNFELALDISFKSDHLLIPKEHRESVMIFYLFEAMLDEKARKNIFNCWAEKVEEDGKEGKVVSFTKKKS